MRRPTAICLVLLVLTIACGLATRRLPSLLPDVVVRYGGDTLWAAMVFVLLALTWRRATTVVLAGAAIGVAFAVEFSQLYHAAWLDTLRATTLGALVFGQGFLRSDLVCYTAGVLLAAAVDVALLRRVGPIGATVDRGRLI